MFDSIWPFLDTRLGAVVVGFVLTTTVGTLLATWLQQRSWKKQTQLILFQKRYDEGVKFLDELSDLIGRRYFLLERYLWAIEGPQTYDLESSSKEYFDCVKEWNEKMRTMRNKARLLMGEQYALRFLDYGDDNRADNPRSLHYILVKAHRSVSHAKGDQTAIVSAKREVEQLNFACSRFLEDFTTEFLRRAREIQLVELPPARIHE